MSRATEEVGDLLHCLTFEVVIEEIRAYRRNDERIPPALIGQAIKLLSENGINSTQRAQKNRDALLDALTAEFGVEDTVSGVPH
ncbi:hypothetical protein [Stenotrophomonas maltophilia]|uniref:hypothetical protein n=1 Tax=Stenotrophomonas maltophilia TaxID=40324 RepID=UPI002091922D|nr:hypothetical protein [Stenotrophomonas maltophilia]MCO5735914.1 hypothetical protein [Stenotrophomonas maltophilia]